MSPLKIALSVIFSLSLFTINSVLAVDDKASAATRVIADIMISLHHFPSDADQNRLAELTATSTTSADEKTIAQVLMHVKHKVADADKPKLIAITKDAAASAEVKGLAGILLSLNHQLNDADITTLKKISN